MSLEANASIFAEWFGIRVAPARVLALMFEAGTQTVTHQQFLDRLGSSHTGTRTSVYRLTEAMEKDACRAVWREGYRLTALGLAECREAIADAKQRKVAA